MIPSIIDVWGYDREFCPSSSSSSSSCSTVTVYDAALEMRLRQAELERVEGQLEKRNQDIGELQARLQDAEKLLVRLCTIQPLCRSQHV